MTTEEWVNRAIDETNKELLEHSDYARAYHDLKTRIRAVGGQDNHHFGDITKLKYNGLREFDGTKKTITITSQYNSTVTANRDIGTYYLAATLIDGRHYAYPDGLMSESDYADFACAAFEKIKRSARGCLGS